MVKIKKKYVYIYIFKIHQIIYLHHKSKNKKLTLSNALEFSNQQQVVYFYCSTGAKHNPIGSVIFCETVLLSSFPLLLP